MDQKEVDHMLNEKAVASEQFKAAFKWVAVPITMCMLVGVPWVIGVAAIISR
jgi:hypothetical protein